MSIVILRGNNLTIKLGLVFLSKFHLNQKGQIVTVIQMRVMYLFKLTHKSSNYYFVILWEALEFETSYVLLYYIFY